jgi:hypothetical protein
MSRNDPRNNFGKFTVGNYTTEIFALSPHRRNQYGNPHYTHHFNIKIMRRTKWTIDVCGGMKGGGWCVKNEICRIFYDPERNDHYIKCKLLNGGILPVYYNDLRKLD